MSNIGYISSQRGVPLKHLSYLDELAEEHSVDIIVSLHEHLPEPGLSNWVVLCIELVKSVKRVSVLKK